MIRYFSTLIFFFLHCEIYAQVVIPDWRFQIDETISIIVVNGLPLSSEVTQKQVILGGKVFTYSGEVFEPQFGLNYRMNYSGKEYSLYFTELPILSITLPGLNIDHIIRDSDVNGILALSDPVTNTSYTSNMGIRIRGASSAVFPKKSYRITLKDDTYNTNKDASILGLRSDKRWLLLAMWNEELKLNNMISHELWRDMHQLYYADIETDAVSSIRMKYIELFINGRYRGVYACAEDMDRKQLKLKNQAGGGELYKGELWGGAVTFDYVPDLPSGSTEVWGGWEMKYPDWEVGNWSSIRDLTDFVKNSSDANFINEISSRISIQSFLDYFIFLNLVNAGDNFGKNTFIAKYANGHPYIIIPWDLDGTWSYNWLGEWSSRKVTIWSNNLYDRLIKLNPDGFKTKLALRWFELRQNMFSTVNLQNRFDTYKNFLERNAVYEREYLIYQNLYAQNLPYYQLGQRNVSLANIKSWIEGRTEVLDHYFNPMLPNVPGCDFTIEVQTTPTVVTPGSVVSIEAACLGANCDGVNYQWSDNSTSVSNLNTFELNAPNTYGSYLYKLEASKSGCVTKLSKASYIVNDNGNPTSLSFSIWAPGPSGTRYKVRDLVNRDIIYIHDLPARANWFLSVNNGQFSNPSGSNYIDFVDFKLNTPSYFNMGWGPENLAGSDGGPYGIHGRDGGEPITVGSYSIRSTAYNGDNAISSNAISFNIISVPLPVKLISFKASLEKQHVYLKWQTTEELNSDRFELEHSHNAKDWVVLGSVPTKNSVNSFSTYSYIHESPFDGINYYRLKMIDLDGTSTYSMMRHIMFDPSELFVYPNPVRENLFFSKSSDISRVEILTSSGSVLKTVSSDFHKGIGLGGFSTGLYIIRIRKQNGAIISKSLVLE